MRLEMNILRRSTQILGSMSSTASGWLYKTTTSNSSLPSIPGQEQLSTKRFLCLDPIELAINTKKKLSVMKLQIITDAYFQPVIHDS